MKLCIRHLVGIVGLSLLSVSASAASLSFDELDTWSVDGQATLSEALTVSCTSLLAPDVIGVDTLALDSGAQIIIPDGVLLVIADMTLSNLNMNQIIIQGSGQLMLHNVTLNLGIDSTIDPIQPLDGQVGFVAPASWHIIFSGANTISGGPAIVDFNPASCVVLPGATITIAPDSAIRFVTEKPFVLKATTFVEKFLKAFSHPIIAATTGVAVGALLAMLLPSKKVAAAAGA